MIKMKKIIAVLLAVLMLAGSLVIVVGAEEEKKPYEYNTGFQQGPTVNYAEDELTADQKLDSMDYRYGTGDYELYVDAYSGEVAVLNTATGEKLFTNPYNYATMTQWSKRLDDESLSALGPQIMSQLIVSYKDITTGTNGTYNSYTWAAKRGQIKVKDIRGGIRVEYSIGKEETRMLVPERISQEAFDTKIKAVLEQSNISARDKEYLLGYFLLIDPDDLGEAGTPQRSIALAQFGVAITLTEPFYVLDEYAVGDVKKALAQLIAEYCPTYTFEDIDEDHLEVGYTMVEEENPLFKMALEYTLDEYGLSVRLPANGIRYDDSRYTLENIQILPYMGVGLTDNGYTFFPDGSGTLFSFRELMNMGNSKSYQAEIYGSDYAYQEIQGNYKEVVRYPVFGLYETETITHVEGDREFTETKERGFLAVIEEGESMASLQNFSRTATTGVGQLNGVRVIVRPRPKDSFKLEGSAATDAGWDVVSSKKFTGSFRIRYIMLTDADRHAEIAAETGSSEGLYECSYVGMAKAYREYLERNGVLTRLTDADVQEDIPLYIEALGSMLTTKKFLSIPFEVMTALTSFSDLATMRDQLAAEGVTNINFILNGFTDGGLSGAAVPYKLKWENAVEDGMNFEELVEDAKADGYGIYPDFDFAYASNNTLFDGLTLKDHAVKTVENRYTSKRVYSATKHTTVSTFEIALSPAYFSHFYEKFLPKYEKYEPMGISVSTLGSDLNSDFDEDEPFNREESKEYTVEALKAINDYFASAEMDVQVMTADANAYAWQYVDHITDVALDSSRLRDSHAAVPFLGMVLHGYVQLAGTPINMEGNLDYALLKSIESGAALQFLLAYDNTEALKDDETLSENFSVQYDIWRSDIVRMYNDLNSVLKYVQTDVIVDHQFISGVRVPDLDELLKDAQNALDEAIAKEDALENQLKEEERQKVFEARQAIVEGIQEIIRAMDPNNEDNLQNRYAKIQSMIDEEMIDTDAKNQVIDILTSTTRKENVKRKKITAFVEELYEEIFAVMQEADRLAQTVEAANNAMNVLDNAEITFSQEIRDQLRAMFSDEYTVAAEALQATYSPETILDTWMAVIKEMFVNDNYGFVVTEEDLPEFTYELAGEEKEEEEKEEENTTASSTRYNSEANKIVRVKYEGGADFLLNFNDYQVVVYVPVNGVDTAFTLDAYGYIVLNQGAN